MHYYFDNDKKLQICGSEHTFIRNEKIKEKYKFQHVSLPLGSGFSQFLNCDIEKWGNNFKSVLDDIISEYDESKLGKYISEAEKIGSEIAYFSAYNEIFYDDILSNYKYNDLLINTCKKVCNFLETREFNHPQIDNDRPQRIRGEIDRLKDIQKLFIELSNQCFDPSITNPLEALCKYQEKTYHESALKLGKVGLLGFNNTSGIQIRFEVNQISNGEYEALEVHTTSDVYDICYEEFIRLIMNNVRVKQCGNKDCKKYFVPLNRLDTLYCDECKDAGIAMKVYQDKLKKNPVLKAYNKAYQSKYAKMVKPYRSNASMKEKKLKSLNEWVIDAKKRIAELETLSGDKRTKAEEKLINWLNPKEANINGKH